jgi:hypothetical protein
MYSPIVTLNHSVLGISTPPLLNESLWISTRALSVARSRSEFHPAKRRREKSIG